MESREILKKVVVPSVALASLLGAAACNSEDISSDSSVETSVNVDREVVTQAMEVCPDGFDVSMPISSEFALDQVGSVDSVLPSFRTTVDSKPMLANPEAVSDVIMSDSCIKSTLLGIFDAIYLQTGGYNEIGRYSLPDENLINVIDAQTKLYRENPRAAVLALENLASIVTAENGVVYVDDFNVIKGQATLIAPERNDSGQALQIVSKEAITEGLFEGYQLRYNLDNTELTPEQKATLSQISELVLITPDGSIIINQWLGANTTNFEIDNESPETTPVNTIIDEEGNEVPVTTMVTPEGNVITVINTPNGPVAVNPETGQPTGEPVPNGSVPAGGNNGNNGNTGNPGEGGECNGDRPTPNCEGEGPGPGGPGQPEEPTPGTTVHVPSTTTPRPTTTVPRPTTTHVPTTTVRPTTTVPRTTTTTSVPRTTTTTTTTIPRTTTTTSVPCPPGTKPAPTGGCKADQPATTTTTPGGF